MNSQIVIGGGSWGMGIATALTTANQQADERVAAAKQQADEAVKRERQAVK